jgi:hypothetical protein
MKKLKLENIFSVRYFTLSQDINIKFCKLFTKFNINYFLLDFWFTFYDGKTIITIYNIQIDSIDFKNDFNDLLRC